MYEIKTSLYYKSQYAPQTRVCTLYHVNTLPHTHTHDDDGGYTLHLTCSECTHWQSS